MIAVRSEKGDGIPSSSDQEPLNYDQQRMNDALSMHLGGTVIIY